MSQREERLRRWAERRSRPGRYARPAWRTLALGWEEVGPPDAPSVGEVERWRARESFADRNADAEYALYRLPGRFQKYAEEYLFADERILALVPWTARATEPWWRTVGRWLTPGGLRPVEGALAVTDRQVLLLRDDHEAVGGTLSWGYRVEATAHERVAAVAVAGEDRGNVTLALRLHAHDADHWLRWTFPPASTAAVREAAGLLRGFVPRAGDTRLRHLWEVQPLEHLVPASATTPGRKRTALELDVTLGERLRLERALHGVLGHRARPDGRPHTVHATAIASSPYSGGTPYIVAVSDRYLVVARPGSRAIVSPLASVTVVELRRSSLANHVAWRGAGGDRHELAYLLPSVPSFISLFAALRQTLGAPPETQMTHRGRTAATA